MNRIFRLILCLCIDHFEMEFGHVSGKQCPNGAVNLELGPLSDRFMTVNFRLELWIAIMQKGKTTVHLSVVWDKDGNGPVLGPVSDANLLEVGDLEG